MTNSSKIFFYMSSGIPYKYKHILNDINQYLVLQFFVFVRKRIVTTKILKKWCPSIFFLKQSNDEYA